MRTPLTKATIEQAERLNRLEGLPIAEFAALRRLSDSALRKAVRRLRSGEPVGVLEMKAQERADLVLHLEAGLSLEGVMTRYACSRRAAHQRIKKVGWDLAVIRRTRIGLGLEEQRPTAAELGLAKDKSVARHLRRLARAAEVEKRQPPRFLSPRIRAVIAPIALEAGLSLAEVTGARLERRFVKARHRAVLELHKTFPEQPCSWLGRPFGYNRSTVRATLLKAGVSAPHAKVGRPRNLTPQALAA